MPRTFTSVHISGKIAGMDLEAHIVETVEVPSMAFHTIHSMKHKVDMLAILVNLKRQMEENGSIN